MTIKNNFLDNLEKTDPEIFKAIKKEEERQNLHIELIASENITSKAVLEAQGSVLTNKYAEGYPNARYYAGNEYIDIVESLAIERAKKLFDAKFANVQPHSGANGNLAILFALVKPDDIIMGMSLNAGGHLTHGAKPTISGKWFKPIQYEVDENGFIDYDKMEKLALENKPKIIIAGGSAYSRNIDYARIRKICDKIGAYFQVDMSHFAGLVAGKVLENPLNYADVVMTTTHKSLRGPRGAIILTNDEEIAKKIDKAVFPGCQGGPLEHVIAAKAVALGEALKDDFKEYAKQVLLNAKVLEKELIKNGFKIVTGGTDNHLLLVDLTPKNITGDLVSVSLAKAGIITNKNAIPFDKQPKTVTSGIRIGTPAGTSRGFKEEEFKLIADFITEIVDSLVLNREDNSKKEKEVLQKVEDLCKKFPIYSN